LNRDLFSDLEPDPVPEPTPEPLPEPVAHVVPEPVVRTLSRERDSQTESALVTGLNMQQREAVLTTDGPVLILAGAGSGKTRVIAHRIAHLVLDKGVPADAILAVTFTNKAAGEMKARVETLLGGPFASWISTFHSLCVRLLRREAPAIGLNRDFVIYDGDDQVSAVREALRQLDLSEKLNPPRRILSRISSLKNSGRRTEDEEDAPTARFSDIAGRYRQILDAAHALDFDDLLLKARELLTEQAAVREAYQRRFRYVLVDEYQDTNRAQYDIVRQLVGPNGNLTVVGDEDQSIYSWRGADIQNILDFEHDFRGARILRLELNYRSTQAILDTASGLVAHNEKRKGKTLSAVKPAGTSVKLHHASDEFEEAAWVVRRIARGTRTAILYRTNSQSRLMEEALMRSSIPYTVIGGVGFYERKEVKDVIAYLRLVVNSDDSVALRRVLNVPARGIGPRTLSELEARAAHERISLWQALELVIDDAVFPARVTQPLQRFRELILALRADAGRLTPKPLIESVLARSGYSASLAEEDTQESQDRLENLAELLSAAADFEVRSDAPTVRAFLDQVSLLSELDMPKHEAPVVLMTLHSAKGLEFDAVFLVGMEEGLLPHSRSVGVPDALEEERRLCYVGMTRAMERLHLSCARSRQVFGQRRVAQPSRFLEELPPTAVEVSGDVERSLPTAARFGFGRGRERDGAPFPLRTAPAAASDDTEAYRPGAKVRHPLFGVGTVVRSEGAGEDLKLTVSFMGIGAKKLVARYAGLERM
jgi:DNA helicase II / ATP-dependent DNA helicase PcrA